MSEQLKYVTELLPKEFKSFVTAIPYEEKKNITELRLRINRPFAVCTTEKRIYAEKTVSADDIAYVVSIISDHSLNSVRDKLVKGFIPLKYGCRAGIAGETVIKNGCVDFMSDINGINLRIANEIKGCALKIIHDIFIDGYIYPTLIVSPPGMGKTTLLRDIARILGNKVNVTVIDERSEIASSCNSVPSFDIGLNTDVLDCCPKPHGIIAATRSLSPNVIITDEIGTKDDASALLEAYRSGVSFVASMHSDSAENTVKKSNAELLFSEKAVKRIILLGNSKGIGTVERIIKYT